MHEKQTLLSPELGRRLAAIDIGTNSIRLVVAEALREGAYRILDEEKHTARLGRQLAATGRLHPEAIEESLDALRRMKQIAAGFQARDLRTIGTCAVREAADGPEFCRRVKDEVGLDVEVISGEKEAELAFLSVARAFQLEGKNVLVADIGGGSTELVFASGPFVETLCPTPLGAVRLTEMYLNKPASNGAEFAELTQGIDRELRRRTKKIMLWPHTLIGSGGTFTTLAEIVMAEKGQTGLPLRGYEITHAEVRHLVDRLRKMSPKARKNVAGLSADRADIIVAGLAIVDGILRRFGLNRLQVHDRGVRDGLLLTMIDESLGGPGQAPVDRAATVERFAANCGVDLDHGRHVARLATLVFDGLAGHFELDPQHRDLLATAAKLQDVGYLINYEEHHKHSYHLILNSRLADFQPQELELIANVARYHRGSEPKKKHDHFRRLNPKDQESVRKLSAILRLAGGLDRSNTQQVTGVHAELLGRDLRIEVAAEELPEVDLWTARHRRGPLEKAFDVEVALEWSGPQAPAPPKAPRPSGPKGKPKRPAGKHRPGKATEKTG